MPRHLVAPAPPRRSKSREELSLCENVPTSRTIENDLKISLANLVIRLGRLNGGMIIRLEVVSWSTMPTWRSEASPAWM